MTGAGKAGAPASLPQTPHHARRGRAIDELICEIEAEWQLGLEVRREPWSPRHISTNNQADKVYGLVKQLYYSSNSALSQAIDTFKELAPTFPRQDRLTLLLRTLRSKTNTQERDSLSKVGTPRHGPPKHSSPALFGKYAKGHAPDLAILSLSAYACFSIYWCSSIRDS